MATRPVRQCAIYNGTSKYHTRTLPGGWTAKGATGLEYEFYLEGWTTSAGLQYVVSDDVITLIIDTAGTTGYLRMLGESDVTFDLTGLSGGVFIRVQLDNVHATAAKRRIIIETWDKDYEYGDSTGYQLVAYERALASTYSYVGGYGVLALATWQGAPGIVLYNGKIGFARLKEGLTTRDTPPIENDAPNGPYLWSYELEGNGNDSSGNSLTLTASGGVTYGNSATRDTTALSAGPDRTGRVGSLMKVRAYLKRGDEWDAVAYLWTVTSGSASLVNATSETVQFTPGSAGTVVLQCQATLTNSADPGNDSVITDSVSIAVVASLAAVKIMLGPGDSITQGLDNGVPGGPFIGYRQTLDSLLTAAGYSHDFVGGEAEGGFVDNQHEGHSGFLAFRLRYEAYGYLHAAKPEFLIPMAGTNDVDTLSGTFNQRPGCSVEGMMESLVRLLPSAKFFYCSICIVDGDAGAEAASVSVNEKIVIHAANLVTRGYDVTFLDMRAGLVSADMSDSRHPDASGYDKMASTVFPYIMAFAVIVPGPFCVVASQAHTPGQTSSQSC